MKKIFLSFVIIINNSLIFYAQQALRTLIWDGIFREYLEYIPQSYHSENPAPVVFCLHGLGDNMNNFSNIGFENIANNKGWIVITPQALEAAVPLFGNIGTAWNSGAGGTFPLIGYTILNESVDDSGFLMAILDSLENHYNIQTDSIFFMGFSMGGFMSHRMAIEHGYRITAIAAVNGTIGTAVMQEAPQFPVNVLHIHGTNDQTIRYEDAGFGIGTEFYPVGMGVHQTINFWLNYNNCNLDPIITYFPDSQNDGKTFERYLYEYGTNGVKTSLIKVIGGEHNWYYFPQNDIDYTLEIYKFFTNTMDFPTQINISTENNIKANIYPNPATNKIYSNLTDCEIKVYDITGNLRKTLNLIADQYIDISDLIAGIYIVKIKTEINECFFKLVVKN